MVVVLRLQPAAVGVWVDQGASRAASIHHGVGLSLSLGSSPLHCQYSPAVMQSYFSKSSF